MSSGEWEQDLDTGAEVISRLVVRLHRVQVNWNSKEREPWVHQKKETSLVQAPKATLGDRSPQGCRGWAPVVFRVKSSPSLCLHQRGGSLCSCLTCSF